MKVYILINTFIGCDAEHIDEERAVIGVFKSYEEAESHADWLVKTEWMAYDRDNLEIVVRYLQ